uniref:SH3b domain-containing protein n=1 Tax=uncultured Thiotrichaceae bacterium TaxID=298394 RepID=A0A6S6U7V1_9GAMM|nr:MAG: Unknown protein [uncultured Thiotrichaceae bacterium]
MKKGFLWVAGLYLLLGLGALQVATAGIYKIQRVSADDSLNVRSIAGVKGSSIVGTIPFDGTGVVLTGKQQQLGRATWVEVHWSGKSGWVNKYYLTEDRQILNNTSAVSASVSPQIPVRTVETAVTQPASVAQPPRPSTAQPAAGSSIFMRCGGTEPFWSMHVLESQLVVKIMDGPEYRAPVEFRKQSENNTSIAVVAGRKTDHGTLTAAFLQKVEMCSDNMSDKNYPYSVTAMLDGARAVSGCCEMSHAK